ISNGTKVYDGTTNVDTAQFKVTGPEGVTVPTLTADDFDLSGITSANVGSYAVTLNQAGIDALQGANTNYTITSNNVTVGKLTITPNTQATVQVQDSTKFYDGTTQADTT
ncbi:MBG domain-containing protein, partial [Secundilactobacillus silagincola]|uniref:MBG domain-containing protein n=1 Tax=Secundilactobacillus silagincola TaxID=1714681 RepID=UPI0015D48AD1